MKKYPSLKSLEDYDDSRNFASLVNSLDVKPQGSDKKEKDICDCGCDTCTGTYGRGRHCRNALSGCNVTVSGIHAK